MVVKTFYIEKTFNEVNIKKIIEEVYRKKDDAERINGWILKPNTHNNKYIAEAAMRKWNKETQPTTETLSELRRQADEFFLSDAIGVNEDPPVGTLDVEHMHRCRELLVQHTDTYVEKMNSGKNKIKRTEYDIYKKLPDNDKVRCGLHLFRCGFEDESQLKQFKDEVWNEGVGLNTYNSLWKNNYFEHFHEENFNFWVMANAICRNWSFIDIIHMDDYKKDATTVEVKRFYGGKECLDDGGFSDDKNGHDEAGFEDYLRSSLTNKKIATIIRRDSKKYYALETLEDDDWMGKKRANADNNPGDTRGAGSDGVRKKVRNE